MYRWVRERHMIGIRGRNFMEAPWAGGIVLLGCVIIAMLLANLPATSLYYRHLLETDLSLMVHSPDGLIDWVFPRGMTVEKLINDGLMVIFFFAVGLEIKREIVCGQLSSAKKALLPVLAAAGGIEAVLSALAIGHGLRYGNPGFAEPIPELGLRPVAETESAAVNSVLSNSFGFGGNCSSLIFAK